MVSVVSQYHHPSHAFIGLRFQGVQRQQRFLTRLQALTPPARDAFAQIYTEAVATHGGGGHVVRAAMWAMQLPEIFGLARENLVTRLQLSRARAKHDERRVSQLGERLEDFHVAADAFMRGITVDEAAAQRREGQKSDAVCAKMPAGFVHPMHNDPPGFRLFRRFVELMRPYLRASGATTEPGLAMLKAEADTLPASHVTG